MFLLVVVPPGALVLFPWTFITGKIDLIYATAMWISRTAVRLTGARVQVRGLEQIDPKGTYIFMSNHVSNIDPPILIPLIPGRSSVMVKRELFRFPILGRAPNGIRFGTNRDFKQSWPGRSGKQSVNNEKV